MGDGNRHKKHPQKKTATPDTPPTPSLFAFSPPPHAPTEPGRSTSTPAHAPAPAPATPGPHDPDNNNNPNGKRRGVGGGEEQPRGTGDGRTGSGSPDTHPTPPCLPPSGPPRVHPPAGYRDRTRRPPQPPQPPPTPQSRRAHTQAAEAERPRVIVYVAAGQQTARDTPPPVWVSGPPPRAGPLRARVPARYQSVKCSADRGTAPGNPLGRRRGK